MQPVRRSEAKANAAQARRDRADATADDARALLDAFRMPERRDPPATVVAHLGPTNSGKSHDALALLAEEGSGTYAAPLRLLAHEAYQRLAARLPAGAVGLHTGEERINPEAPIICCTTELAPMAGHVLVLDEVHWIDDPDRGWAWGRLLAAANYRHHRLVGALNAEPVLRHAYGDALEVRRHSRLVELRWGGAIGLDAVEPGSLVVAFSRKAVLALARELSANGLRTAVLYGALPPAARRVVVERFMARELDALCVTDVIGHGINLPARSVVMAETSKYDGQRRRALHRWELAQIVGRAGRFGLAEEGIASVLRGVAGLEANATLVRQAVEAAGGLLAAGPGIETAPIRPTLADLEVRTPAELFAAVQAWQVAAADRLGSHPWLRAAPLTSVEHRLDALRRAGVAEQLDVDELWRLATMSVDSDDLVLELATNLAGGRRRLARPRLRSQEPSEGASAGQILDWAERDAARVRGLAALGRAFPALAADEATNLLAAEDLAAERIIDVLPAAIAQSSYGRCGSCGRGCAPWATNCERCSGRMPRLAPQRRGSRGPRR